MRSFIKIGFNYVIFEIRNTPILNEVVLGRSNDQLNCFFSLPIGETQIGFVIFLLILQVHQLLHCAELRVGETKYWTLEGRRKSYHSMSLLILGSPEVD